MFMLMREYEVNNNDIMTSHPLVQRTLFRA
jgi:hypothetical protein